MNKLRDRINKERWLTVKEAKNRMFTITKDNIVRWVLRHNMVGILEPNECFFLEVIFPARSFTETKYARYKMKAALLQFDYKSKSWMLNKEILTITLTGKDYRWFQAVKIKAGDRVKVMYYQYTPPKGMKFRSIRWECSKRGSKK